jgi:adenosylcobalamin-dependent ribonucleoside-triphosphate reductase
VPEYLSFALPDELVEGYGDRPIDWGFPCGGGLSLGELTFVDKYSRLKPDGTKETWAEVCRRVIEGTYSILKDHCLRRRTPWDEAKALRSAAEAYERMFTFRWLPPGRGLAMMGTEFVHGQQNSAALQNCAFVSTGGKRGLVGAAHRLMEMSMLGVGVGFDSAAADEDLRVYEPAIGGTFVVDDTREGWCDSTAAVLRAYLQPGGVMPETIDYSLVRPAGAPIRGYGGVAAGPGPLMELHQTLVEVLNARIGDTVDIVTVGDIMNLIGRCVVAGGVRRTAEIWLCADEKEFLDAKNAAVHPRRMEAETGWGWSSNNSVLTEVGTDYTHLAEAIGRNGEPGLVYLDLLRNYGRLADGPDGGRDYRVAGVNPCGEQGLEDGELCTLVNLYPTRCDDQADFERSAKFAYLYAKAVTLLPTHWEDANEIMRRNHRIGASLAGQAQFVETYGWVELKRWQDSGYHVICEWDRVYSGWLGVRESVKKTTTKPDGSTVLLVGCTPGVGWPTFAGHFLRRFRFSADAPIVATLRAAGVPVEPDVTDPRRVIAELPAYGPDVPGEWDVSIWKKAELAAATQRHWSDNSVSVTLSFRPDEADQIADIIHTFDGRLKTMSFLPLHESGGAYPQMPFEKIDQDELDARFAAISPISRSALYGVGNDDADIERFCTTDRCDLPAGT